MSRLLLIQNQGKNEQGQKLDCDHYDKRTQFRAEAWGKNMNNTT